MGLLILSLPLVSSGNDQRTGRFSHHAHLLLRVVSYLVGAAWEKTPSAGNRMNCVSMRDFG